MNKSYVLNALLAIFSALAAAPATAQTTDYPNRPVRIIVPQTAGGAVDIVARAIAQKLSESWGQQVIIDNRPGANGIIGMEAVAKAPEFCWCTSGDACGQVGQRRQAIIGRQHLAALGKPAALFEVQIGNDERPAGGPPERASP